MLDSKFWSYFGRRYWEKKPVVFKDVNSPLVKITSKEVFSWLLRYCDHCRKTKTNKGLKLFIDGQLQDIEELLELLPTKKDRSFEDYHQRMSEMFEDYCLVCDELMQTNPDKQNRLGDFLEGLYHEVGMPNRFTEMGLYLGNYRKTPFGVHVDACGVFSFPVVGTKKFRLWEESEIKKHPKLERAHEYKKYLKSSQLLRAEKGDMAYWPSHSWHIAESDGTFSVTWSLGIWVDRPFQDVVSEALQPLIAKKLGKAGKAVLTPFSSARASELPASYREAVQMLSSLKEDEILQLFQRLWLDQKQRKGFKKSSPSR